VPSSGGLAFALAFFISLTTINFFIPPDPSNLIFIFLGVGMMTIVGFLDDLKNLSAFAKILFQIFFCAVTIYALGLFNILYLMNEAWSYLILISFFLFLIWIINTFNFIDGADGLLASNTFVLCCVLSFLFYVSNNEYLTLCLISLAGVSLGFLSLNWAPAKIFMGDSGSLFFGSIFVVFICGSISQEILSIWTWLILLSIFYVETTVTLVVRLFRKENFFSGRHELHAYQRLVIKTQDHSSPSKVFVAIQCLWTIPATLFSFFYPQYDIYIYLITVAPMTIIFYYYGPRNVA
jgi:Fuc2NAc and GlcNAc transferase